MPTPATHRHKLPDQDAPPGPRELTATRGRTHLRLHRPDQSVETVQADHYGMRWLIRSGFEQLVREAVVPALIAPDRAGVIRIKHGRHRSVYRVSCGPTGYYVKHYRAADIRAWLNANLLGPRAVREWHRLYWALQAGVRTLVPVAVGWRQLGPVRADSYLVTLEEPDTCQLDALLAGPSAHRPRLRRLVLGKVVELLAQAHRAGLDHRDLHAGNLLVRLGPADCDVFLIDLLSTRWRRGPLPWSATVRNLLQLGVSVLKYTTAAERYAFLAGYLAARPELGRRPEETAAWLEERLWQYARYCWWKRDEQCVGENRRFYFMYSRKVHAHAARDLPPSVVRELMAQPDRLLTQGQTLKSSPSSTVVRTEVMLADGQRMSVLWKRFRCSKPLDRLRALLYRSPGLRSWRGANALRIRGIATPRPLLFLETRRWGIPDEGYLMTEFIEGAETLVEYVQGTLSKLDPKATAQRRWELAERLGRVVARLHRCCLSHRDLKFPNWIVVAGEGGKIAELYVIDLAGLQVWRHLPHRRRVQNIARLLLSARAVANVTSTEALRFLRAYLPQGLADDEWKRWWRAIEAFARRKLARNLRWGRVVT